MLRFSKGESALFVGTEQEGIHKGLRTLFVVNMPPILGLVTEMMEHDVKQVYFGAGFLSPVDWFYVKEAYHHIKGITKKTGPPVMTVESDNLTVLSGMGLIPEIQTSDLNFVVTMMMDSKLSSHAPDFFQVMKKMKSRTQIKFDSHGQTFLIPIEKFYTSEYKDYGEDKLLWSSDDERNKQLKEANA